MAILAAALLPLLELQSQLVRSAASFERADTRTAARQNAIAYLKTVNFARDETGNIDQGGATLQWTATAIGSPKSARDPSGQEARYEMILYDVDIALVYSGGLMENFKIRGLGWRPKWSFLSGI